MRASTSYPLHLRSRRVRALALATVVALVATLLPVSADARPAPFVTGGGWVEVPAGASRAAADAPSTTLNTGFVVKPAVASARGRTTAQLRASSIGLRSTELTVLDVDGAVARWEGTGRFDGRHVRFEASIVDGDLLGDEPDRFRLRVLGDSGDVLLDTEPGADPNAAPTAVLHGQAVIHGGDTGAGPDAPVDAVDDTVTTDEDVAVTIDVLANDTGGPLTITSVGDPTSGTTSIVTDGIRYAPTPDTNGTDSFTYTVTDGTDTDTATVTVTITPVNDPPTANAGPGTTVTVGEQASFDATGSSDPDNDTLTFTWTIVTAPTDATATLDDATTATPTLTPDTAGTWQLELTVDDGTATDTDQTTLQVTAPDDIALTVRDPLIGVARTTPVTVTLPSPAPAGGTLVDLATSDPSVATVSPVQITVAAGTERATAELTGVGVGSTDVTATATGLGTATDAVTVTAQELTILEPIEIGPDELTSIPVQLAQPAATDLTVTFSVVDPSVALLLEDGLRVPTAQVTIPAGQQLPSAATNIVGVALGATEVVVSAPGVAPDRRDVTVALRGSLDPVNVTQPSGFSTTVTASISAPAPLGGVTITLSSDEDVASFPASITIPEGQLSTTFDITGANVGNGVVDLAGTGFDGLGVTVTTTDPPNVAFGIRSSSTYAVGTGLQVRAGARLSYPPSVPTDVLITSSDPGITLSADPGVIGSETLLIPDVTSTTNLTFYVQGSGDPGAAAVLQASAPLYLPDQRNAEVRATTLRVGAPSSSTISVDQPPLAVFVTAAAIADTDYCSETDCNPQTYYNLFRRQLLTQQPLLPGTLDVTMTATPTDVLALVDDTDSSRVASFTKSITGGTGSDFNENVRFRFDGLTPGFGTLEVATPAGFLSTAVEQRTIEVTQPEIELNFGSSRPVALGAGLQTTMSVRLSAVPAGAVDVTLTVPADSGVTLSDDPTVAGTTSLVVEDLIDITAATFWVQDRTGGAAGSRVTVTGSATGYTGDVADAERRPSAVVFQGGLGRFGSVRDVGQGVTGTVELAALSTAIESPSYRLNRPLHPRDDGYIVNRQAVGPDGALDVTITSTDPVVASLTALGAGRALPTTLSLPSGTSSVDAGLVAEQIGSTLVALEQPAGFTTPGEFFADQDYDAFALEVQGRQLFDFTPRDRTVGRDLREFLTSTSLLVDQPVTVTVADPAIASLSRSGDSTEAASISFPVSTRPQLQVNGLSIGTTVLQYRADGYTPVDVAVTVVEPTVFFTDSDLFEAVDLYADDVELEVRTGVEVANSSGAVFTNAQGLRPLASAVPIDVVSNDPTIVTTAPETVQIGPADDARGATLVVPQTIGFATLTLTPPAGWVAPTTGEDVLEVRVDAPAVRIEQSRSVLAVDGQDGFDVVADYGPPEATNRVVRSSAPSVAVVSADPTVLGEASITVPLAAGQTTATYYVQALAPGTTQITIESPGYGDLSFDVEVLPATVRWSNSSYDTGFPRFTVLAVEGVRSDGTTVVGGDSLRPGATPTVQLTSGDPAIVAATSPVTLDASNGGRLPLTDLLTFGVAGTTTVAIEQPALAGYVEPPSHGALAVTVR